MAFESLKQFLGREAFARQHEMRKQRDPLRQKRIANLKNLIESEDIRQENAREKLKNLRAEIVAKNELGSLFTEIMATPFEDFVAKKMIPESDLFRISEIAKAGNSELTEKHKTVAMLGALLRESPERASKLEPISRQFGNLFGFQDRTDRVDVLGEGVSQELKEKAKRKTVELKSKKELLAIEAKAKAAMALLKKKIANPRIFGKGTGNEILLKQMDSAKSLLAERMKLLTFKEDFEALPKEQQDAVRDDIDKLSEFIRFAGTNRQVEFPELDEPELPDEIDTEELIDIPGFLE